MRFSDRITLRRGPLACLLACLAVLPLLAGCGEDRSNLIPTGTSEELVAKLDEVQSLADAGDCFAAADASLELGNQIERLGGKIDPRLKRSLLDGVTQLQLAIADIDAADCAEPGTTETTEPPEPETDTSTEITGTTDPAGTTGESDQTDEETDPEQDQTDQPSTPPSGNGNTNQTDTPVAPTTPTTPSTPTTPTQPSSPGSGGLGPG